MKVCNTWNPEDCSVACPVLSLTQIKMKKIKDWFYENFSKLDNKEELDWLLIVIMAFVAICVVVAMSQIRP